MMALASASEPLRAANLISSERLYQWELVGLAHEPVTSSSGFTIVPDYDLTDTPKYDLVIVIASLNVREVRHSHLFEWLRRQARYGTRLAAVSTASWLLARAGLLSGRQCTIHWEMLRAFQDEFPDLRVERALYTDDGDILTCAGGTSALDMMLSYIAQDHGPDLAAAIAENFLHSRIRPAAEEQRMSVQWRFAVTDGRLARAIALMEEHMDAPASPQAIADIVGISSRQMERLFQKHFGKAPVRFHLELRLMHARKLLQQSTDSIQMVAHKCGFSSPSHFGRAYRERFGSTPGQERRGHPQ